MRVLRAPDHPTKVDWLPPTIKKTMKTTNALVAAALAGVFAAGTTVSQASPLIGSPIAAEKEKDDCPAKDKEKCPAKDKDKEEGAIL
jgi:hypothetical protein